MCPRSISLEIQSHFARCFAPLQIITRRKCILNLRASVTICKENKTFDELHIPLYIVAADLLSGEEIVFDHGPVVETKRASMSVIGVIEPAQTDGRFLIDGGTVNPTSTQLLADIGTVTGAK